MRGEAASDHRPGFTLIEILIVVLVIGVLAAIMIYRTNEATERSHLAVLRSDLRSLTIAQELYHQSNMVYGPLGGLTAFEASAGVSVDLSWVDPGGYAATATHERLPDVICGVFRGPAAEGAAGPADAEGVIDCQ